MTATIPQTAADIELALASSVSEGDTTATLSSITDPDGVVLADGLYGFTVDLGNSSKEYIIATLTSTALSNIFSISSQGAATIGFTGYHRAGAIVAITDWVVLDRVVNVLTGVTGLDGGAPLSYDSTPALGSSNQLATVQYVLDHVNGGAVSFNAEIVAGMAGETISTGQWVYLKESDGRWYKTSSLTLSSCVGVRLGKALGAGTAGNGISGGVFINGLETSGTYAAFTTYYLQDTAGTIGTSAGTNSVIVGISDGNSKLIVAQTPASYRDALVGSSGTPSAGNKYLTADNAYTSSEDVVQNTQNAISVVGAANTAGNRNKLAQSFIPTRTKIRGIKLYKTADSGTFTGTFSVALQVDSAGSPSGSDLISATVANAAWTSIGSSVSFNVEFSSDQTVTPGTTYWIVITTSTADSSNHPNLGISSTSVYAGGILKYNNTTDGWVTTTTDLYFSTLNGVRNQVVETDSTTGMVPTILAPNATIAIDATGVTVGNSNVETTLLTKVLPVSSLRTTSAIRLQAFFSALQTRATGPSSQTIRVKLNATTVASFQVGAGSSSLTLQGVLNFIIANNASLTSQVYFGSVVSTTNVGNAAAADNNAIGTGGVSASGTAAIDMTGGDVVLVLTCQNSESNASTSFTYAGSVVEKLST